MREIKFRGKHLGYILDEQARVAYYTDETKRGKIIESKPQRWYKFMPIEQRAV